MKADWWRGEKEHQSRFIVFDQQPMDKQVNRACHDCNAQWMGGYERRTRDAVIRLAHGESFPLTAELQRDVAVWGTIVALLRATADPGFRAIPDGDYEWVRKVDSTPPGYAVWMMHGETRWDFPTRHSRFVSETGSISHFSWLWIGQLVLIVAYGDAVGHLVDRLRLIEKAVTPIYPFMEAGARLPDAMANYESFVWMTTLGGSGLDGI